MLIFILYENNICNHTFPEYLNSTIPNIDMDGGMCLYNSTICSSLTRNSKIIIHSNYLVIGDSIYSPLQPRSAIHWVMAGTRGARRTHHAPPSAFIGTTIFFFIM